MPAEGKTYQKLGGPSHIDKVCIGLGVSELGGFATATTSAKVPSQRPERRRRRVKKDVPSEEGNPEGQSPKIGRNYR